MAEERIEPLSDLRHFTFCKVAIEIRSLGALDLAGWVGKTFRGGFGTLLRRIVCVARREHCQTCILRRSCVYATIFNPHRDEEADAYGSLEEVPRPFALDIDRERLCISAGERARFGVTLIGRACRYLPYIIYTFVRLGENGLGRTRARFNVEAVYQKTPGLPERCLYHCNERNYVEDPDVTTGLAFLSTVGSQDRLNVKLTITSPMRLKAKGHLTDHLEFRVLIGAAIRRIALLQYFHCGTRLSMDFAKYLEEAGQVAVGMDETRWVEWERFSGRQKTRMRIGGIVGCIEYKDVPTKYLPVLRLGQFVHIGKLSTFGFGKYTLEVNG